MRTYYTSHTTVTYPESIIWMYDSNVIQLESSSKVGAVVTITTPTYNSRTLTYFSELNSLTFSLDDVILSMLDDNISPWSVSVKIYENGSYAGTLTFAVTVYNGHSFITRCHGMQSTYYVYAPSELTKLHVYAVQNGTVVVGQWGYNCYKGINSYNLSGPITTEGIYYMDIHGNNQTPPIAQIEGAISDTPTTATVSFSWQSGYDPDTTYGGDIWHEGMKIFPCKKKIIYQSHCEDYNFIELMYIDTDGCRRYLGGKLIEEDDNVKEKAFNTIGTAVWNQNPHRFVNSSDKSIKVGFSDIEKLAYPQDLLYSDTIWMRTWEDEWEQVRLKSSSFKQKDEDYLDFELEIYTHER